MSLDEETQFFYPGKHRGCAQWHQMYRAALAETVPAPFL